MYVQPTLVGGGAGRLTLTFIAREAKFVDQWWRALTSLPYPELCRELSFYRYSFSVDTLEFFLHMVRSASARKSKPCHTLPVYTELAACPTHERTDRKQTGRANTTSSPQRVVLGITRGWVMNNPDAMNLLLCVVFENPLLQTSVYANRFHPSNRISAL